MLREWFLAAFLLISSIAFATDGKISGTIVDENYLPVPHMRVDAFPKGTSGPNSGGGSAVGVFHAKTDEHGEFLMKVGPLPAGVTEYWEVYPLDEEKGFYPRPSSFFGSDVAPAEVVELSPGFPAATVELRLRRKMGALIAHIVGAAGIPVQPTFDLERSSETSKGISRSYPRKDSYRLLLPADTNVTLTVTSPGYKPWSDPSVLSVASGQELILDIHLEPGAALSAK
jgi:hypothetical protein